MSKRSDELVDIFLEENKIKMLECAENGAGTCRNALLIESLVSSCEGFKIKAKTLAEELFNLRNFNRIKEYKWVDANAESPTTGKRVLVKYLYTLDSLEEPQAPWVSCGNIDRYSKKWVVDSQHELKKFIVVSWMDLPDTEGSGESAC